MTFANQTDFLEALGVPTANTVQFTDRACGSGKTKAMYKSFEHGKKYFVVAPTARERDDVIESSEVKVAFHKPREGSYEDDYGNTRRSMLVGLPDLIEDGCNIVCTHTLFDMVNIDDFDLSDYHVIIDEVFDCVKGFSGPSDKLFGEHWVDNGYATLDESGKVSPTSKWIDEGDEGFKHKLLPEAKRGRLHRSGNGFYVTVVPVELFTRCRSCTVMTYLAEGSLMAMYLRKLGVPYEVSTSDNIDKSSRAEARERLKINYVDLALTGSQGHGQQGEWVRNPATQKKVASKLRGTRGRHMKGVSPEKIIITCRKSLWFDKEGRASNFAKDARLAKARWLHKATKGTNDYRLCTHAIHVFDLNLHPAVQKFLSITEDQQDLWRQSELIQWLYRTDLRNRDSDQDVYLHMTSKAMMRLVENWLSEDPIQ